MARASRLLPKELIEKHPKKIYKTLIAAGFPPCVARDWANEPKRRDVMMTRSLNRAARKLQSSHGRVDSYKPYRRILKTIVGERRNHLGHLHERQFHATKGWRSYRVVE